MEIHVNKSNLRCIYTYICVKKMISCDTDEWPIVDSRTLTVPSWESSYCQQISHQIQQDTPLADTTETEYTTSTWNGLKLQQQKCHDLTGSEKTIYHFLLYAFFSQTAKQNHEPDENQMRMTLWLAKVAISFVAFSAKTVIEYICQFGASFTNLQGFRLR